MVTEFPAIRVKPPCISIAVAINYHEIVVLKTTHLLSKSSVDQKSDTSLTGLKLRCHQGCVRFRRFSRGESFSLPFSVCRGCSHSLAYGLFPLFSNPPKAG